ncbi:hypothetical protein ACFSJQ_06025 [Vibrio olivae]|uniref:DUF4376 domain-containing protein n=1 Tax=Vibrio olivae TaxID=1243002 RepID=A0ABV5HJ63_9VIBR
MKMKFWTFDEDTLEVNPVAVELIRQSKMDEYPKRALLTEPLPKVEGKAVIVSKFEHGRPTTTKYVTDLRGETLYSIEDCSVTQTMETLGDVPKGWTAEEPSSQYCTWQDGQWTVDTSAKHIAEFNQVDEARRDHYAQMVDPLIAEAVIKRLQGDEDGAKALEQQALGARAKIQAENPWPEAL